MRKSAFIYQEKQEICGQHIRANQWICYSGKLTVYDRKTNPVVLKLISETAGYLLVQIMDEKKEFKGNSITEVYAKLSKWLYKNDIIFQY